ncbi:hypothetical protein ACFFRR_011659 [Megaselia abdita]
MSVNWSILPNQNLQSIFQYFSVIEAKSLSLVCRNWRTEVDFYLKDKIWLCVDRVTDLEYLAKSVRRFESLKIPFLNPYCEYILKVIRTLNERKLRYVNAVKEAHVSYEDSKELLNLLKTVNRDGTLSTLHLNLDQPEFLDLPETNADLNDNFLRSVETLNIESVSENFHLISKYFRNLKTLEIKDVENELDLKLVKTLLNANLALQNFTIKGYTFDVNTFDLLRHHKHLKKVKVNIDGIEDIYLKNYTSHLDSLDFEVCKLLDDDFRIIRNIRELKELSMSFHHDLVSEHSIKELWRKKNLSSLTVDTKCWFSMDFKAPQLTSLVLNKMSIDNYFMEVLTKSTPNMKTFKLLDTVFFKMSFRVIQEMADNWKSLEHLDLDLLQNLQSMEEEKRLKYEPSMTPPFEKLQTLVMGCRVVTTPKEIFHNLKAPNLKELCLWFGLTMIEVEIELTTINNYILEITKNTPNIESLELRDIRSETVVQLCRELGKLKSLYLDVPSPLATVKDVLENSSSVNSLRINNCSEVTYFPDDFKNFLFERRIKLVHSIYDEWTAERRFYGDNVEIIFGE